MEVARPSEHDMRYATPYPRADEVCQTITGQMHIRVGESLAPSDVSGCWLTPQAVAGAHSAAMRCFYRGRYTPLQAGRVYFL